METKRGFFNISVKYINALNASGMLFWLSLYSTRFRCPKSVTGYETSSRATMGCKSLYRKYNHHGTIYFYYILLKLDENMEFSKFLSITLQCFKTLIDR